MTYKDYDNWSKDQEKERHRNRRNSRMKYKKHLEKLSKMSYYPSGAYYRTTFNNPNTPPRIVRCYRSSTSSYIKMKCNRRIRRSSLLLQHGAKNRYTEFWWDYC